MRKRFNHLRRRDLRILSKKYYDTVATVDDLALVSRAMRERWNISQETRDRTLKQITSILEDEIECRKTQIAAAKVLVQMDALNLREKAIETPKEVNVNLNGKSSIELELILKKALTEIESSGIILNERKALPVPERIVVSREDVDFLGPGAL